LNYKKEEILDRARGALLGSAVGDALGAGYEFQPPLSLEFPVVFKATGQFKAGEFTDDTAQTIGVALAASRSDLRVTLDEVSKEFHRWYKEDSRGIGIQTDKIFQKVKDFSTAGELLEQSQLFVDNNEKAAGNGSLMRTAPIALPYLSNPEAVGEVASSVSALTHADLDCREAASSGQKQLGMQFSLRTSMAFSWLSMSFQPLDRTIGMNSSMQPMLLARHQSSPTMAGLSMPSKLPTKPSCPLQLKHRTIWC
jgi:hypothetical protein